MMKQERAFVAEILRGRRCELLGDDAYIIKLLAIIALELDRIAEAYEEAHK